MRLSPSVYKLIEYIGNFPPPDVKGGKLPVFDA